jgi:hypothetical protein
MEKKPVNYLYPLSTERKLQCTKDVVKGDNEPSKIFTPKRFNAAKKEIVRNLVKGKTKTFNKATKTRDNLNPLLKANLPTDPMRAPDPRPGNAMHITNTVAAYNGYQR